MDLFVNTFICIRFHKEDPHVMLIRLRLCCRSQADFSFTRTNEVCNLTIFVGYVWVVIENRNVRLLLKSSWLSFFWLLLAKRKKSHANLLVFHLLSFLFVVHSFCRQLFYVWYWIRMQSSLVQLPSCPLSANHSILHACRH